MKFKIENGVSVPSAKKEGARSEFSKTALMLKVGQSFCVPGAKISGAYSRLAFSIKQGFKFTLRTMDGGVRI